jgi:hypothetical protein
MKSEKIQQIKLNENEISGNPLEAAKQFSEKIVKKDQVIIDKIPSRFKLFPNGTVIYGKKIPITDLKDLATMNKQNSSYVINTTLSNTVSGIDIGEIPQADKLYLIAWLRAYSYDDYPYQIKWECPYCNKEHVFNLTLDKFYTKFINDDVINEININGDTIVIDWPRIKHESIVEKIKNDPNVLMQFDKEILDQSLYISSVNGKKLPLTKAYEYLKNEIGQIGYTRFVNFLAKNTFGIQPFTEILCKCGNVVKVPVKLSQDYFLPDIQ